MADYTNYTNTWNNSSLLQNQFPNVNDYLALFGYQGNTPTAPDPTTPDPTAPDPSQGIVNAGINQYQNQGGDGPQGDFGIFGNLQKDTARDFNVQTYDEEYGDFIDTKITGYKNVNTGAYQDKFGKNLQPAFSNKGKAFGIMGTVAQMIGGKPKTVGGYIPGSIKGYYDGPTEMFKKTKKFIGDKVNFTKTGNLAIEKEKERVRQEEAAAAAAANRAKVEAYTGRPMSDYRQSRPQSEQNYTGGSTNSNPSTPGAQDGFSNNSGMGRTGYDEGGEVEAPNPRVLELMLNEKMSYEEALKEYKNRMKQQPYIDERYNMGPEPILEAAYGGRVGFKKGGLATMFKLKG